MELVPEKALLVLDPASSLHQDNTPAMQRNVKEILIFLILVATSSVASNLSAFANAGVLLVYSCLVLQWRFLQFSFFRRSDFTLLSLRVRLGSHRFLARRKLGSFGSNEQLGGTILQEVKCASKKKPQPKAQNLQE